MEDEKKKQSPVSLEEQRYIQDSTKKSLYAISMLQAARLEGKTVDGVLEDALVVPGNGEHKDSWLEAANFLKQNSERFGLKEEDK